jgi:hypothetical protein
MWHSAIYVKLARIYDLKACDRGKLVKLLRSWTLSIDETIDNVQERNNCTPYMISVINFTCLRERC